MHGIVRRSICLILTIAAIFTVFAAGITVFADDEPLLPPDTNFARYAYLYHIESGTVMFEKNTDQQTAPASMVKLMTGILAIEALGSNLGVTVTVTAEMIKNVSGNNIRLQEGENITVKDLLNALIIGGANDAAYVLAYKIAGSSEAFVDMMNAKAAEIGCTDTVYKNPTGMDEEGMYTTVKDTAKVAMYAYTLNIYMTIAGIEKYEMPETNLSKMRRIYNKNYFVVKTTDDTYYRNDILGLNAGSTDNAGGCIAAICDTGTYRYLCIIMGASVDSENIYSYITAGALLDWGFKSFEYKTIVNTSDMICEIPVLLSNTVDHVMILPEKSIVLYMPISVNVSSEIEKVWSLDEKSLRAPVEAGAKVGNMSLYYQSQLLETVNLVTKSNVDRSQLAFYYEKLMQFLSSRIFIAAAVAAVILSVLYVLVVAYLRGEMKKKILRQRRSARYIAGNKSAGNAENPPNKPAAKHKKNTK